MRIRTPEQLARKNERARKINSEGKFTKRHLKLHKILGDYILYQDGRVFSIRRGIFLVAFPDKNGYPCVRVPYITKLHRLLAINFIPNPKEYPFINHKDGVKSNFSLSNLEWCTASHNQKHAYDTGLKKPLYGINNPACKIKYIDAVVIKEAISNGHSGASIARYYKVNKSTIYRIKNDVTWKNVA